MNGRRTLTPGWLRLTCRLFFFLMSVQAPPPRPPRPFSQHATVSFPVAGLTTMRPCDSGSGRQWYPRLARLAAPGATKSQGSFMFHFGCQLLYFLPGTKWGTHNLAWWPPTSVCRRHCWKKTVFEWSKVTRCEKMFARAAFRPSASSWQTAGHLQALIFHQLILNWFDGTPLLSAGQNEIENPILQPTTMYC